MLDAKFEPQRSIIISLSGKHEQALILEQKTLDRLKIESIYSDRHQKDWIVKEF